jgi:hypothetical protein
MQQWAEHGAFAVEMQATSLCGFGEACGIDVGVHRNR